MAISTRSAVPALLPFYNPSVLSALISGWLLSEGMSHPAASQEFGTTSYKTVFISGLQVMRKGHQAPRRNLAYARIV